MTAVAAASSSHAFSPRPLPFSNRNLHTPLLPFRTPPLSPATPNSTRLPLSSPPPPPLTTSPRRPGFSSTVFRPPPQQLLLLVNHSSELFHDENAPAHRPHRYRRLLRLAVRQRDLDLARAVHAAVVKNSHQRQEEGEEDTHLINTLISTYLKLGRLSDARKVFDGLSSPDVVSHTSLVSAYAKCGREDEALDLFGRMRRSGVEPNAFSLVAVLTSCIRRPNPQLGSQVHALAIKSHHRSSVYVSNALVGLYVGCGHVDDAVQLFGEMLERDVASWNTVISGMVKDSRHDQAFELFRDMRMDGFGVDRFTLSSLLTAAVEGFARAAEGEGVHAHALKIGLELDLSVANALIAFYTKFGCVEDVVGVFCGMPTRDVISWTGMVRGYMVFGLVESAVEMFDRMPERNCVSYNALLAGFCRNNKGSQALELFKEMVEDGMELSDFTVTSVVNACAMVSEVEKSEQIHGFVVKLGCGSNDWIEAALLDMYTKCGRMEDAQKMFSRWVDGESRSIAWTSLICGYARNGQPDKAMSLFYAMRRAENMVIMDEVASTTVLGVCGLLGSGEMGKQVHCYVLKSGNSFDLMVGNAIFSMYSKCGNMEDAFRFFDRMPRHDLVSWNASITARLLHRQGDEALDVWKKMERLGIRPDHITFVLILSSCKYTNSDPVDTCRSLFLSMTSSYSIRPASEHYAAVVDVLGYRGCFDEAEELIKTMPFEPDVLVWRALLDGCRLRSNLSLGRQAVQRILALEPQDPSSHVLVSNLYSASGRWHCSERIREEMREKGLRKHPARSWIVNRNVVHSFYARDRLHSQSMDIYRALEILILECMKAGYAPDTSFVLHEVEEWQKKNFLFYHSAKLAAVYGHLVIGVGKPVRVMKNIRLCGDCHVFFKCLSAVVGREISLRDSTGFHCFKGGECSCRDYW